MAGYFIGPYSPGFVADAQLSEQLAEIGVILMMFWVGIHIKWQELVDGKKFGYFGRNNSDLVFNHSRCAPNKINGLAS